MTARSPHQSNVPARAIVTGGAGFVGSHLVDRLSRDRASVLVVDDLSTGRVDNLPSDVTLEEVDIATGELDAMFHSWRPDVVFHLAAQASVPLSLSDPMRDLAVNVVGTHRVASSARLASAERLVFVSSGGAVYGETSRPATELTRPNPASYYGVHKLAAEGHVSLCGIPFAIARPSNIYGPIQTGGLDGAVVAAFVEAASATGSIRINGDGSQTRDFIDVRDAVDALILLADPATPAGIWNIASGRRVSITELADLVEAALGHPLVRRSSLSRPGDVRHSSVSAGKLRRFGWRPGRDLPTGVRELIDLRD